MSADSFVIVMKTGKLYELEMAKNELENAGVPFFVQQDSSSGLTLAMPLAPTMGPGIWYSVHVPQEFTAEAERVLEALPFETKTNPDVWDFGPTDKTKRLWKLYIIVTLLIPVAIWAVSLVYRLFKGW